MSKYPRNIRQDKQEEDKYKISTESFLILMVAGYFIASLIIFNLFTSLDLSLIQLVQLFCLFLGLCFLIPIRLYRKILPISYYEYILFNILSASPFLILLAFSINMMFRGDTYIESYEILDIEVTPSKTIYTLENNAYEDKEYLRSINPNEDLEISGSKNLAIYFSDGLLGIRIIEKKKTY